MNAWMYRKELLTKSNSLRPSERYSVVYKKSDVLQKSWDEYLDTVSELAENPDHDDLSDFLEDIEEYLETTLESVDGTLPKGLSILVSLNKPTEGMNYLPTLKFTLSEKLDLIDGRTDNIIAYGQHANLKDFRHDMHRVIYRLILKIAKNEAYCENINVRDDYCLKTDARHGGPGVHNLAYLFELGRMFERSQQDENPLNVKGDSE